MKNKNNKTKEHKMNINNHMNATYIRNTININCHPATFKKWWKDIQSNWTTCSAAKYVNPPRRAFGVYIIDGEPDAVRVIANTLQS